MRVIVATLSLCLVALAATAQDTAPVPPNVLRRAVALARSSECFRQQEAESRLARKVIGRPAVSANDDGTFTVSESACPIGTSDVHADQPSACASIVAIVDTVAETVACGDGTR